MPHNKFKPIDTTTLSERFRVVTEQPQDEIYVSDLLNEIYLRNVIESIKPNFATDRDFVIGSQLIKRLGFLLVVPSLYTFSTDRIAMSLDWSRTAIVPKVKDGLWLPDLYLENVVGEDCSDALEEKRQAFFEQLFQQLADLVQAVSQATAVPRPILWENIVVYIYWVYETVVDWHHDPTITNQFYEDFNVLIHQLSPELFGERFNPIQRFYNGYHYIAPEQTFRRVRTTCCFNFEASSDEKYCGGCPQLAVNKEACRATHEAMRQQTNSYSL
ncbi:IucA/IucC family C-terminal-domain containing protein [Alkalibacillus almallahensis]|uniref:IucA/IucC family C-terminal-domain containing protein n=1 Tax=Alkalibacillus almallahensis TaxID=1379154 RepID=UPI0014203BF3|nr:IucA/IucC family C-terminal-domain containing protein [Alkalibacillus almallahensis]NIK12813.1 ferric iron reductase protein FhuF [Alkalibacillus almallahensis]